LITFSTMSQENVELVLRGYHAFLDGDLDQAEALLDDEIEWHGAEGEAWPADLADVHAMLEERLEEGLRIELERCIGKGDQVLVAFRASGVQADPTDDRPLQSRRYFTIGRYFGVITVREGRVVRVQDYPHMGAALDAIGLDEGEL
jgi:ketosteroid isomerase-like protein